MILMTSSFTFGQISAWNFNASSNAATSTASGTTASDVTINGASASTPAYVTGFIPPASSGGLAFQSEDWKVGSPADMSKYLEFTVTSTSDVLNFDFLELAIERDTDGPQFLAVTTSQDAHGSVIATINLSATTSFDTYTVNFTDPVFTGLTSLTIRLYGYGATTTTGTLTVDEIAIKSTVLPVELAHFTGEKMDASSLLEWATYSEVNNAYYEVEHSTDGKEFSIVKQVEGAGNSNDYNTYSTIHENPEVGANYYRLRQVDFDGQYTYSDIVMVEHKAVLAADVKVFPNPVVDWVKIELPQLEADAIVAVYNANGQLMRKMIINSFDNVLSLEVMNWTNGQYFIQIETNNQVITKQFIKF